MRDRVHPGFSDLRDGLAHARRVDLRRRSQRAHGYGNVIMAPFRIDDVREQERAALILGKSTEELPSHERMQLRVFVDRPLDADEQTLRFEVGEVLLKIEAWPGCRARFCHCDCVVRHMSVPQSLVRTRSVE